jgi:hypothetical protein
MTKPSDILQVLDRAAESFVFPMLDNGYVYLAATRMSLYRSQVDWALVLEVFGFSPRAGLPDLGVWTFGSLLRDRDPPEKYSSPDAYANYLVQHPNDDARFFHPLASGAWQDPDCDELVASDADELLLRNEAVKLPTLEDLSSAGVTLSAPPQIQVFELCRFLAARYRDRVLGTEEERRVSVPAGLTSILRLDEWTHPDLADSVRPSEVETFQQIARVLSSGNAAEYRPSTAPNTHWSNWPDGGIL